MADWDYHPKGGTPFVDSSDTVDAEDINSIYTELGPQPSGSESTVTDRLATQDALNTATDVRLDAAEASITSHTAAISTAEGEIDTLQTESADYETRISLLEGISPPPPDPPSGDTELPVTVPDGYTVVWSENFDTATGFLKDNAGGSGGGGRFAIYTGNQDGTSSRNTTSNVSVDTTNKYLRLRTSAEDSGGYQYTSGYVGTNIQNGGGTEAEAYFPLFARYEAMVRMPMVHSIWNCMWLDYRGQSSKFEIDIFEMFTAQTPGRASLVLHSNVAGYGLDLGSSKGQSTWYIPGGGSVSYSGQTGATRYGKSVDLDDPFPSSGHTDWHLIRCDIGKVDGNAGGWTVDITFYIDGIKCYTWRDTITDYLNGEVPAWYESGHDNVSGDDAYSWDIRFDSWVGGAFIGKCETAPIGGGDRILTYDGTLNNGDTGANVGLVPDADLWIDDINNDYYYDIAWIRVLEPDNAAPPPPTPLDLLWEFTETGSDEADLTANGSDVGGVDNVYKSGTGTADVKFDTGQSTEGGQSIRFDLTGSGGATISWDPTGDASYNTLYVGFKVRFDTLPGGTTFIMSVREPGTTNGLAHVRITSGGLLELRNYTSTVTTSSFALSTDTWYRMTWGLNGSASNQTLTIASENGLTLHEEISGTFTGNNGTTTGVDPGQVIYGLSPNAGTLSMTAWFDELAVDDASDQLFD